MGLGLLIVIWTLGMWFYRRSLWLGLLNIGRAGSLLGPDFAAMVSLLSRRCYGRGEIG